MNKFVFVVCGGREHIDKLNFSLRYIRHFSSYPILVVTDSKRNEIKIEHDNIIDVNTPLEFDHHQASIYMKTGLYKFLPWEDDEKYCYLDSDIVAISTEINHVFDYFISPILFAKDHCPFNEFSPHAMKCNCLADVSRRNKEYESVDLFFQQKIFLLCYNEEDRSALENRFSDMRKLKIRSIITGLQYLVNRYILPLKQFKFGQFYFDKKNKFWYNQKNEIIDFDFRHYAKILRKNTGIRFDYKNNRWLNKNGENITPQTPHCEHLSEYIKDRFQISIPAEWRHWNGGVFIFDKNSIDFMDFWHKTTLNEFNNTITKTRDQGTLAVSVWKNNLQNNPTLPKQFNFIAEFRNQNIQYDTDKGFTDDNFQTSANPFFLHIFHEWGHTGWSIWDYVIQLGNKINNENK